jgi:type I restriction enzyme M protein
LRDDGVSYGDYVEQLTYLVFLKMADERSRPPLNKHSLIPAGLDWQSLLPKDGADLDAHYRKILESLGKETGTLGVIFRKSQNKIQDPAKLKRLVDLINGEVWIGLDVDVKGEIYEGLLEKNAEDVKSGAGQYFTPRPLIRAIVDVMVPAPGMTIYDPACGTGGFLLIAYEFISQNFVLDKEQKRFLKSRTFGGKDIVDSVARLCVMNLYLHGIGGDNGSLVDVGDSLVSDPSGRYDLVLTNPPFGRKSSITIMTGEDEASGKESLVYERTDFSATTSNKQLNFLQHVKTLLKINGRAAIVLPDNVLFEAGAGETIRRKLLYECDLHTLLRLPTGIFYKPGVKANVLFFERKPAREKPWTENLWIYDFRTNTHFTLKGNPLRYDDLEDFVKCYNAENIHERKESERFRAISFDELVKRDKVNLDIFWLKDESIEDPNLLPDPEILTQRAAENLETAVEHFNAIYEELIQQKAKRDAP